MLTRLLVRNFKRFEEVDIPLDSPVLFVGPNNSGKTTLLQALALWDLGMRRWREKGAGRDAPKRPGVVVNRRDVVAVPGLSAKQLWRRLHVRNVTRVDGQQRTDNIRIEILVEGQTRGRAWKAGLEFDYANQESFYCRPLRLVPDGSRRMEVPDGADEVRIGYLPPMSGVASVEPRLEPGAVNVRLGEGRTADVLRNLLARLEELEHSETESASSRGWTRLVRDIEELFLVRLDAPRYIPERGEIAMSYKDDGVRYDLTASGRGMLQTLLLLAYLSLHPGIVLVLDEPDAHLEVVRQREIYDLLRTRAEENGSQLIVASHSEVLLQQAAGPDTVIAFVGTPHDMADRKSQVAKALREIGYGDFEQARKAGFILYVEGDSDRPILSALAERTGNREAAEALKAGFARPVGNHPSKAVQHYWGLREAHGRLRGAALFDRLKGELPENRGGLPMWTWRRREIENYIVTRDTLLAFARASAERAGSLFGPDLRRKRERAMEDAIRKVEVAFEVLEKDPWSPDTKVSEEVLPPILRRFAELASIPNPLRRKRDYAKLARYVPEEDLDQEVREKLDAIAAEYAKSTPDLPF